MNKFLNSIKDNKSWQWLFSGIGLQIVPLFLQVIKKNFLYTLVASLVFMFIYTITLYIIKTKAINELTAEKDKLIKAINELTAEKDKLILKENKHNSDKEKLNGEITQYNDTIDDLSAEITQLENELSTYIQFHANFDTICKNISHTIESKKHSDKQELQRIVSDIETIFKSEVNTHKASFNTSIFTENNGIFKIFISTHHTQTTIESLTLNKDSLVGSSYNSNKYLYCKNIDKRENDFPFVELDKNTRRYKSIISIPYFNDDLHFILVVTCTIENSLLYTYEQFKDVIANLMNLFSITYCLRKKDEE